MNAGGIAVGVGRLAKEHGLPLAWRGEGLGVAACKVLKAFLSQRHRCRPSAALQAQIVSAQDGRCAACGGICEKDDREFDHVVPLRDRAEPQLYQLLCVGCHAEKTRLEPRSGRDPMASVFSKATWDAYVASPRLPALTYNLHVPQAKAGDVYEVDVRRCRRNALLHSPHPFPVFCALDSVEPCAAHRLHDLQYIDAGPAPDRPIDCLRKAPYSGPPLPLIPI